VFNIPICKVEHQRCYFFFASERHKNSSGNRKTDQTIYDITLNEPVAIIMGSEDRGVNPSVLKIVDEKQTSMFGTIGSLECICSCGAFIYEAVRQKLIL
jgi:23S rRNA (guanosine2251-2'-O)-methyltransferase